MYPFVQYKSNYERVHNSMVYMGRRRSWNPPYITLVNNELLFHPPQKNKTRKSHTVDSPHSCPYAAKRKEEVKARRAEREEEGGGQAGEKVCEEDREGLDVWHGLKKSKKVQQYAENRPRAQVNRRWRQDKNEANTIAGRRRKRRSARQKLAREEEREMMKVLGPGY